MMPIRLPTAPLTALVMAALTVCAVAAEPTAAPFSDGTVFDTNGGVIINRGATSVTAARGVVVRRGDRVMVPESAVLTIRCPEADAMRIDTPGTFTFSGCPPAVAAAEPPVAEPPVAEPAVAATPPSPVPSSRPRMGGGGSTLGIIGGLALLGAAAGGGGGGGGSSGSTSPPVSP